MALNRQGNFEIFPEGLAGIAAPATQFKSVHQTKPLSRVAYPLQPLWLRYHAILASPFITDCLKKGIILIPRNFLVLRNFLANKTCTSRASNAVPVEASVAPPSHISFFQRNRGCACNENFICAYSNDTMLKPEKGPKCCARSPMPMNQTGNRRDRLQEGCRGCAN